MRCVGTETNMQMKMWGEKWVSIVENNMTVPQKNIKLSNDSPIPCLGSCLKEQKEDPEQTRSQPLTTASVEATPMSIHRCMNKQRNQKILFSLKG